MFVPAGWSELEIQITGDTSCLCPFDHIFFIKCPSIKQNGRKILFSFQECKFVYGLSRVGKSLDMRDRSSIKCVHIFLKV
jgi:hypothetical protein